MISFKKPELSDKSWVDAITRNADLMGTEFSFVNAFMWEKAYRIEIGRIENFFVLKSEVSGGYTYPCGTGDLKAAIELLMQDASQRGWPFRLLAIPQDRVAQLEELFPGKFRFTTNRDNDDYIYNAESLATLAGKKLHSKRNHINRFLENNPDWHFEPITPDNLPECLEMNHQWCILNDCASNESAWEEVCAAKRALQNFQALELTGGLLRVDGRVVAYTFGHPINAEVFDVRVEKAFADVQGAYPMINQQFVQHCCQGYRYINREDDTGDEGLRKAKLSYKPEIQYAKYRAELAESECCGPIEMEE